MSVLLTSLLLSYTPVVLHSSAMEILNPSVIEASASAGKIATPVIPVRISRSFFESNLDGKITVSSAQTDAFYTQESPITYTQEEPTAPPPAADARADFRDFRACASFSGFSDQVGLCFNVMPDVSSISANSKTMTIVGIQELADRALNDSSVSNGCTFKVTHLEIQNATRSYDNAVIEYVGQAIPKDGCKAPIQTLTFKIELQRV